MMTDDIVFPKDLTHQIEKYSLTYIPASGQVLLDIVVLMSLSLQ